MNVYKLSLTLQDTDARQLAVAIDAPTTRSALQSAQVTSLSTFAQLPAACRLVHNTDALLNAGALPAAAMDAVLEDITTHNTTNAQEHAAPLLAHTIVVDHTVGVLAVSADYALRKISASLLEEK